MTIVFQPARYCLQYSALRYLLVLRSEQTGVHINMSLGANESEVMPGHYDGLEDNHMCIQSLMGQIQHIRVE